MDDDELMNALLEQLQENQLLLNRYVFMLSRYDNKLKELLGEEKHKEFSDALAKETFFMEITNLPDCDFKEFVLDNFKEIVGDE